MFAAFQSQDWQNILKNIHIQRIAEIIRRQFNLWVIFISDNYIQWLGTQQSVNIEKCFRCHQSDKCHHIYHEWFEQLKESPDTIQTFKCHQNLNGLGSTVFCQNTVIAAIFVSGLSYTNNTTESFTDRENRILNELIIEITACIQNEINHFNEISLSLPHPKQPHEVLLYNHIIGHSDSIHQLKQSLNKIANSESPVLIEGQTGVGKKLIARAIHSQSKRKRGPFIVQNCNVFTEEQLDAELFGQNSGVFPGSFNEKSGLLDIADRGTIYLENIEFLSAKLQFRILKLLNEGTFIPVGTAIPHTVDVRIIASSDNSIHDKIHENTFSKELYDALNIMHIHLPALSERKEDIPLLADHFLKLKCQKNHKDIKAISPEAMEVLNSYPWPGNISELENEIERMVILSPDDNMISADCISQRIQRFHLMQAEHLINTSACFSDNDSITIPPGSNLQDVLDEIEKRMISNALVQNQGNRSKTAEILGISRRNLIRKIEKLDIHD